MNYLAGEDLHDLGPDGWLRFLLLLVAVYLIPFAVYLIPLIAAAIGRWRRRRSP